jgi:hypothetical protein
MNKTELLRLIRKAKSSHIRWRSYAQALVAGLDVPEDAAPKDHRACGFGKWYYDAGVRQLGHLDVFRDIEISHEILHGIYARIHQSVTGGRADEARPQLEQLIGVSRTLLEAIGLLEQEVLAIPDSRFPAGAGGGYVELAAMPAANVELWVHQARKEY